MIMQGKKGLIVGIANIPALDADYVELLKLMKQYYDEGLISPDFFTLEGTACFILQRRALASFVMTKH